MLGHYFRKAVRPTEILRCWTAHAGAAGFRITMILVNKEFQQGNDNHREWQTSKYKAWGLVLTCGQSITLDSWTWHRPKSRQLTEHLWSGAVKAPRCQLSQTSHRGKAHKQMTNPHVCSVWKALCWGIVLFIQPKLTVAITAPTALLNNVHLQNSQFLHRLFYLR